MKKYLKTITVITMMAAVMIAGAVITAYADDAVYQDGFYTTTVNTDKESYGYLTDAEGNVSQRGFSYPSNNYDLPVTIQIQDGKIVDVLYPQDPNEIMANTSSDFNYLLWAMNGHNVTEASYNYLAGEGKNYEKYHLDPKPPMNGVGMKEQIVKANGTEGVDTVTAATITSRAIINSVNQSLEKAKTGAKDETEPVPPQVTEDVIPEDGIYFAPINIENCVGADFSANTTLLKVQNGQITALQMGVEQRQASYPYIFAGPEAEALAAGEAGWLKPIDYDYGYKNPGSLYKNVPIQSLDKPLHFVMFAKGSGNWFNRLVTINQADLVRLPIGDYEIDPAAFKFTGGTGKVELTCSKIHVTENGITADVAFSSSKYTKAAVDGVEYTPNADGAEGTSTFTVPLNINAETIVSGTTTAMSAEHTIDYTCTLAFTPKANTMTVAPAKVPKLKAKALKKKAKSFLAVNVENPVGDVTYAAKTTGKSKKVLKFNAKTGKITVKKGAKKGKYSMSITVIASGGGEYVPAEQIVDLKVVVK